MRFSYRLSLLLLVLLIAGITPVRAETYRIQIRQINPDGAVYIASCDDESREMCHLFMGIVPQNDTSGLKDKELDIGIFLKQGTTSFQFKSGPDYFFVSGGKNVWQTSYIETGFQAERIRLYSPHPLTKTDPDTALVFRQTNGMLAELEISLEPEEYADEKEIIPEGVSYRDLDRDGTGEMIVKAWLDNFNAHGFYVVSFYKKSDEGRLVIIPFWQDNKFINTFQTVQGAECTVEDIYFENGTIVISRKDSTIPVCEEGKTDRQYYSIKHNKDGTPGTPEWYFEKDRDDQPNKVN